MMANLRTTCNEYAVKHKILVEIRKYYYYKNMETNELTKLTSDAKENQQTGLAKPAVILIVRAKDRLGKDNVVKACLNGNKLGVMDNNSFLLCKTYQVDNKITLNDCEIEVNKVENGEKILIRYVYDNLSTNLMEVTSTGYEELKQSVIDTSRGKKVKEIGGVLFTLFLSILFIWGGLSGEMVLRFTNSSTALVVVAVLMLIYAVAKTIMLLMKEKADVTLDKFLEDAGHNE